MGLGLFDPLTCPPDTSGSGLTFDFRFFGMQHWQWDVFINTFAGCKTFDVPEFNCPAIVLFDVRRRLPEQSPGIFEKQAVIGLQNGDDMFVMVQAKVKEGSFDVDRVGYNCVKEPCVIFKDPLQQSLSCNNLTLARTDHLHVQRQSKIKTDQMANYASMIIFDNLFVVDLDPTLGTLIAVTMPGGKKTRARPPRQTASANYLPRPCYGPIDG